MVAILTVLAALTALAPLSVDVYTPSLPQIESDLAAADWLAQASVTGCLLGIGIGQVLWGPLSDRFGRRPVILVGVIGWAAASAASAASGTATMLICARVLAGLCGAACIVAARSVVRDLTDEPHSRAARIGMLSLVSAAAPVVAPLLGALVASLWGWRADFVALTVIGAALAVVFAVVVPETLASAERTSGGLGIVRGLTAALRDRELLSIAVPLAAFAFGFYAYVATTAFIVEREFGYPPLVFGVAFGINALAMVGANLVFRRLVRRTTPNRLMRAGLVTGTAAGAALLVLALMGAPAWADWLAALIFAASAGFVLPGAHAAGQATLVASGAASALTGAAQFLGGVLGSPVSGAIGPTAVTLGALILGAGTVALLLRRLLARAS
jgi:DHA1 family bicyclomycin/chloramphenicol resistance-like MFS transporter